MKTTKLKTPRVPVSAHSLFAAALLSAILPSLAAAAESVLFIGNSFTFGYGAAVRHYRADSVTDLNHEGIGGVPALFKSFADQAGLDYDVYLETRGGSNFDFHLENKLGVIGRRPWDVVVMHGYSTLDRDAPNDPAKLVATSAELIDFLREKNPDVDVYLTATWARADQIYVPDRPWTGQSTAQMANDIRAGYDLAAAESGVTVNGVGEAWQRAIDLGIADPNPYDGIEFDKVDLWTWDHYHASDYGYYLHALMAFGNVTGLDPRSLGPNECSGYELGMSSREVEMLQQAAYEQLASEGKVEAAPLDVDGQGSQARCS